MNIILKSLPNLLSSKDGWTPLHVAAKNGHAELVEMLIKSEADVNATSKVRQLVLYCIP